MGGSLGAQISNSDRDFMAATFPQLANTPEGNRQMIAHFRRIAERQQQVSRMAREYAARNNGRLDPKFDDEIAKFAEENPLFPRNESQQPQQQQGGGIRDGATATNPQTGQRIQFRNGQWVPMQ
jgi:hypothetical protein